MEPNAIIRFPSREPGKTGALAVALLGALVLIGGSGMPAYLYWGRVVPLALGALVVLASAYLAFREAPAHLYRTVLLLVILFVACLYLPLLNDLLSINGDNVRYIGSAAGIRAGRGFVDIWRDPPFIMRNYGPGMPLLLQPSLIFFPDSIVALKVPIALCGVAGAAGTWLLFSRFRGLPRWTLPLITLLAAVNGYVLDSADQVMSEIPFYASLVFALLGIITYSRRERAWDWSLAAAAGGIGWAFLVRSNGAALLIAALMAMGLKRQWRKMLLLTAGCALVIVPWSMRNSRATMQLKEQGLPANSYVENFSEYYRGLRGDEAGYVMQGKTVLQNFLYSLRKGFRDQVRWTTDILFRTQDMGWRILTVLVILTGLLVHLVRAFRHGREELAMDFFIGGMFMLNLMIGVNVATRYVLVLSPMLVFYWLYGCLFFVERGIRATGARHDDLIKRGLVLAITLALLFPHMAGAMRTIQYKRRQKNYGGAWGVFHDTVKWVGAHADTDRKIVTRKPQMVYPWIKRQAICYPFIADQDSMLAFLTNYDYIILDAGMGFNTTQRFVIPVVNKYLGSHFRIVHRSRPMYYGKRPLYQYVVRTIRKQ